MANKTISPGRDPVTGLTPIEAQLVALYDGGVTQQTKIAEIIGCSNVTVCILLKKPHVIKAIQDRSMTDGIAPLIASREELQAFWTSIMRDEEKGDKDRLKASELLGKSFALFVDKVEQKTSMTFEDMLQALDSRGSKPRSAKIEVSFDDL